MLPISRAGNPARLFALIINMPKSDTRLLKVHQSLLDEMASLHARLPDDIENVSEAFERYARIVSLMVRSLDVMTRLEKNQQQDDKDKSDPQARHALIRDMEQKLARLAQQDDTPQTSERAER